MSQAFQEKKNSQHQDQIQPDLHSANRQMPTLLRIYADNQDKKSMCCFWGTLLILAIITAIIAALLPNSLIQLTNQDQLSDTYLSGCHYPVLFNKFQQVQCSPYNPANPMAGVFIDDMGPVNQFALFYLEVYLQDTSKQHQLGKEMFNDSDINQVGLLDFYYIKQKKVEGKYDLYRSQQLDSKVEAPIQINKDNRKIYKDDKFVGFYSLQAYENNLQKQSYLLTLSLDKNISQLSNVKDLYITVLTVNPQFTVFSIVIRYIFFVIAILSAIHYIYKFFQIPVDQRILQQKMIVFHSILTIAFNDPLYPATILAPNPFTNFTSVFVVINLVIFLMFLWMVFLRRICYQNGMKQTQIAIRWWMLAYFIILYIITLILYVNYAFSHYDSGPIVPSNNIVDNRFIALEVITTIIGGIGICYILALYTYNCCNWGEKLWRNQLFMLFTLFFTLLLIAMFIVGGLQIYDYAAPRVMIWYMAMNVYTFYLQKLYLLSPEQSENIENFNMFEKNAILSNFSRKQVEINMENYNNHGLLRQDEEDFFDDTQQKMKRENANNKYKTPAPYLNQNQHLDHKY